MVKVPTISVIIATYNSGRTLRTCLTSLKNQDYPKKYLEIIMCDGGSTDDTLRIARSFHCRIVNIAKELQNAEYNKGVGLIHAKRELILFIDHDNVLPHRQWLRHMIEPLIKHREVVAVEPLRCHYSPKLNLLDRYVALFGVNDPVPYYLGKADRMDYIHEQYNLLGRVVSYSSSLSRTTSASRLVRLGRTRSKNNSIDYYIIQFDKKSPHRIPTLGANGFLIRRKLLLKAKSDPGHFFHIDVNVDLVKKGYTAYAFIKDDIIHLTHSTIMTFFRRRIQFIDEYYEERSTKRRYSVVMKGDEVRLSLFVFYTITLVKPLWDSMQGFLKIADPAWFLHPIFCWAFLFIYGWKTVYRRLSV